MESGANKILVAIEYQQTKLAEAYAIKNDDDLRKFLVRVHADTLGMLAIALQKLCDECDPVKETAKELAGHCWTMSTLTQLEPMTRHDVIVVDASAEVMPELIKKLKKEIEASDKQ